MLYFIRFLFSLLFLGRIPCRHKDAVVTVPGAVHDQCNFRHRHLVLVRWTCSCGWISTKTYKTKWRESETLSEREGVALWKQLLRTHGLPAP